MFVGKVTVSFFVLAKTATPASEDIKRTMPMRLKKDFISRLLVGFGEPLLGKHSCTTTPRALSSKTKGGGFRVPSFEFRVLQVRRDSETSKIRSAKREDSELETRNAKLALKPV